MCSSMQAQRSRPAEPAVPRCGSGNLVPRRLSRILSSTFCMISHGYFMDQRACERAFRGAREAFTFVAIDQQQFIVVRFEAEARSDAIRRDEVDALRRELRARIGFGVIGLGRKA